MGYSFKKIATKNITKHTAHKKYEITISDSTGSFDGLNVFAYSGSKNSLEWDAANNTLTTNGYSRRDIYDSIYSKFYYSGSGLNGLSGLLSRDHTSLFSGSYDTTQLNSKDRTIWKNKSFTAVDVITVPHLMIGDGIKPGSVRITSGSVVLQDDSKGNLYYGPYFVGNVFYDRGIIVQTGGVTESADNGNVIFFDDFSSYNTIQEVTSSGNYPKTDAYGYGHGYYNHYSQGENELIENSQMDISGKILQLGGNDGSDHAWFISNQLIKVNPDSLYEIEIRARQNLDGAAASKFYLGVQVYESDGTTKRNKSGLDDISSQHYIGLSGNDISSDFTVYKGYFKGYGTPAGVKSTVKTSPAKLHPSASGGFVAPLFIANWSDQTGQVQIDYLKLTEYNANVWPKMLTDCNLEFKNTYKMEEHEYMCNIGKEEFNASTNHSILSDIPTKTLKGIVSSSEWNPYITTVGLYDQDNELLAVGKLGQAIKKSEKYDTSFIIRFDT